MIFRLFLGQVAHGVRPPVEQRNVRGGRGLGLVGYSQRQAIGREVPSRLGDILRVGEIDGLTARARYGEQIEVLLPAEDLMNRQLTYHPATKRRHTPGRPIGRVESANCPTPR